MSADELAELQANASDLHIAISKHIIKFQKRFRQKIGHWSPHWCPDERLKRTQRKMVHKCHANGRQGVREEDESFDNAVNIQDFREM